MRAFLYRLVERLHDRARPLSRNKHFHVFDGAGAKRALRIDKHLKDLERQLERLQAAGLKPAVRTLDGGRIELTLQDPKNSLVRTATLTREEAALLRQHPSGSWALSAT